MKICARISLALLIALAFSVNAFAADKEDTPKSIINEMIGTLQKAVDAIDGIEDAKTATAAEKKLDVVLKDLEKIADRAVKLKGKKLGKEDEADMKKKLEAFSKKFQAAAVKASKVPEGQKVLLNFALKMQTAFQKIQKSGITPK